MSRTLGSPRHEVLRLYLIRERKKRDLTQTDVAKRIKRYQPYLTLIERGQRRVDVVEFLELAEAIGFDPVAALRAIHRAPKR
jgi:transcriptional regulator with XRE-family HTH domain